MSNPAPDKDPASQDGDARNRERRLWILFWKHIVAGFSAGIGIAAIGLVILLLFVMRTATDMPWLFAALALYHLGMIGGLIGVGVFMHRIKAGHDDDEGGDDDEPGGGLRQPVPRPVRQPRPAIMPARLPAPA